MITGTAFVDLSASYDTVTHRLLIQGLCNTTLDSQLCRVIQNLLSDRRFYVELYNERSRWIIQKNGLPQGSVLCCCLPTPMTLASGWSPLFPLVVYQPASPSIWPEVQSLRRGLSTNPGVTMWCVCGCS